MLEAIFPSAFHLAPYTVVVVVESREHNLVTCSLFETVKGTRVSCEVCIRSDRPSLGCRLIKSYQSICYLLLVFPF